MNYDEILCRRIQEVKPSGIRRFFDILEEMKDAISLGVGEPDFVTPWHIRDAGIYSLEKGFTKYTSNAGMAELRREIAAYLNRRFGLQYDFAHQIVVTVGGSEAIDLALRCILNPGDEVIIPVPSCVCYGPLTSMAGGTPVYVELKAENEFRLTAAQLRAALTPRTKAVVLPFPSNPTGGILERADLAALAGFYIGCACYRIPVGLDGLITAAAALAAVKLSPTVRDYLLASHVSAEPAGAMALEALGLKAAIHGEMCLGEGTGAAALFPLLDMAAAVYGQMESFEEIHVEQYRRFGKEEEE